MSTVPVDGPGLPVPPGYGPDAEPDAVRRAIHALASSGRFSSYLTYSRPGRRWFAAAAGPAPAEILMSQREISWRSPGSTGSVPLGPRPLRRLGDIVHSCTPQGRQAYGYVAFEVGQLIHGATIRHVPTPLAHFFVPDLEIRWDAAGSSVTCPDASLRGLVRDLCVAGPAVRISPPRPVDLTDDTDRRRFEQAVARVVARIKAGRLHKAIVSRQVTIPFPVDLVRTYLLGLTGNTPARSFLLQLGELRAAGFSPEVVVEVSAEGLVHTQPLAGTRPFGAHPEQNRRWRHELSWDAKECFEHCISVRLATEELDPLCDPATVGVTELLKVKERGTVQHLGSQVGGQLSAGRDAWDALEALFPAVTASGVPKREALDTIGALEPVGRGLYAGAVCMAGSDGSLDAALALRTVFQTDRRSWLQAGAGIVRDSEPAFEFTETTNKLRSVAGFIVPAAGPLPPDGLGAVLTTTGDTMTDEQSRHSTEQIAQVLRTALVDLGIDEQSITPVSRLRRDLELDSTELVQISLELSRSCGRKVKLESDTDYSFTEVCALVADVAIAGAGSAAP